MKRIIFSSFVFLFVAFCLVESVYGSIRIQHGPYLQNLKVTEVTVVWLTDKPSIGWVELLPDDGTHFYAKERPKYYDTTNGVKNTSKLHSVKLSGLKPGTSYRYRVYATEVLDHKGVEVLYGSTTGLDVWQSEPPVFKTNDARKKETSFLVVNDIHGRTKDMTTLFNVGKIRDKDLVFFNGDMLSILRNEEELFTGFMDASVDMFAKEIPMYYARGNHETRGLFATAFQNYFSPKESHLYYLFTQGPVCFIVLDTGEDKPDSDIEYYGITDYDAYRSEQALWLEKAIESDEFKRAKFRVVIGHMPPAPKEQIWHGPYEVLTKIVPILNKAKIDVMLCGHLHEYIFVEKNNDINFPIVINSNDMVLTGKTNQDSLILEIMNLDGKLVDQIKCPVH